MHTKSLGEMNGQLLLFGGPYSNLQATEAIYAEAQQHGIPADNIICTGDIVAYCAQPNETVELIRDWGVTVVMGNCEESIGNSADDCGCGFNEGSACDVLSNQWYTYTNSRMRADHRHWMRSLPRRVEFTYNRKHFAVVHGSVNRINQFVFGSDDQADKFADISNAGVDGIIGGHCGLPFTQIIDGKLWHNPGVVGMPANDGASRVWYSLWDIVDNNIHIDTLPLTFDAEKASSVMRDNGLNNGYAEALTSGYWPSMDVLPEHERAQNGIALNSFSRIF